MRRIAIILAACVLMAGDVRAEPGIDRHRSAWPEEQTERSQTPLSKWLPSILPFGSRNDAEAESPSEGEPAASEPAPEPRRQQPARRAPAPEPEPEPEPQLTRKEMEAEARWWKETGDAAVAAFSRCLQEHVIDEITRGRESSYPDFVTTAMNGRCAREFAAMAQLILQRHGEDHFARIARKLIATKFVPAVKRVAQGGPADTLPPEEDRPRIEAEMRQSKEAMLGCLAGEADRLAASTAAAPEELADRVIAACQAMAEAYIGKLEQLWPGSTGVGAGEKPAAIVDASYRPAIIERIATMRGDAPVVVRGAGGGSSGGKADAETPTGRQETTSHKRPDPTNQPTSQSRREAFSPPGPPVPGSPAPANSRP